MIKILYLLPIVCICSIFARDNIIANVASRPQRSASLKIMIESILFQVDRINVFLNNYPEIPEFLKNPKINVYTSQEYGDLGANGKFFLSGHIKGYYFTIDDDFRYPKNYVEYLIKKIEQYQRKTVICVHGNILKEPMIDYFKDRIIFLSTNKLDNDTFINLAGTGTTAYHTDTLSVSLSDFPLKNKVDLYFAIAAKNQKIPILCIERPPNFVEALPESHQTDSIYYQTHLKIKEYMKLINANAPWPVLII